MSEPIVLYDHTGTRYVTHSPSVAAAALREGVLFVEPPAHTVPEPEPPVMSKRVRKPREERGGVL